MFLTKNKKAQQEMVGFVLIIVVVTIAAFVFLIISLRNQPEEQQNLEVENMLNAIFSYTTDCAISYEPDYDTGEDLFKSCYNNKKCSNNGQMACTYLETLMKDILEDLIKTESQINYYQLLVFHRTPEGQNTENIIKTIKQGNCTGKIIGAQKNIAVDSGNIIVRLNFCYEE